MATPSAPGAAPPATDAVARPSGEPGICQGNYSGALKNPIYAIVDTLPRDKPWPQAEQACRDVGAPSYFNRKIEFGDWETPEIAWLGGQLVARLADQYRASPNTGLLASCAEAPSRCPSPDEMERLFRRERIGVGRVGGDKCPPRRACFWALFSDIERQQNWFVSADLDWRDPAHPRFSHAVFRQESWIGEL